MLSANTPSRPKVGLLALTLELYETLAPHLRGSREAWVRQAILPALQPRADVLFKTAVFRRDDIEATITEYETAAPAVGQSSADRAVNFSYQQCTFEDRQGTSTAVINSSFASDVW